MRLRHKLLKRTRQDSSGIQVVPGKECVEIEDGIDGSLIVELQLHPHLGLSEVPI